MFMNPGGNAVVSIAAEFLLDSQRLLRCNGADRQRRMLPHRRQKHFARTRHRSEFDREEIPAPGLDNQLRTRRIALLRCHVITLI